MSVPATASVNEDDGTVQVCATLSGDPTVIDIDITLATSTQGIYM